MLFVLSPAKSLDYETPLSELPFELPHTQARFTSQSAELIGLLKTRSPAEVSALMDISDDLAQLNVKRYKAWRERHDPRTSRQAFLAFDGDVYDGLQARTLSAEDFEWAQQHVAILSGLYGVLRPLDRIRPYRLEMGTSLPNAQGKNLYQFWRTTIADALNRQQRGVKAPILVNLASDEYFRSVDLKTLKARVVTCVFEELHKGEYKIISFPAKRARGMMARFAIEHRLDEPRGLRDFDRAGYRFAPKASEEDRLVFRRDKPPPGEGLAVE